MYSTKQLKKIIKICEILGSLSMIGAGIFCVQRDIYYIHSIFAIILFISISTAIILKTKNKRLFLTIILITLFILFVFLNPIFEWFLCITFLIYYRKRYKKKE